MLYWHDRGDVYNFIFKVWWVLCWLSQLSSKCGVKITYPDKTGNIKKLRSSTEIVVVTFSNFQEVRWDSSALSKITSTFNFKHFLFIGVPSGHAWISIYICKKVLILLLCLFSQREKKKELWCYSRDTLVKVKYLIWCFPILTIHGVIVVLSSVKYNNKN